jgi:hypothetical protein
VARDQRGVEPLRHEARELARKVVRSDAPRLASTGCSVRVQGATTRAAASRSAWIG